MMLSAGASDLHNVLKYPSAMKRACLGRGDLAMEVSEMDSAMALHREGHLAAASRCFCSSRASTMEVKCLILLSLTLTRLSF